MTSKSEIIEQLKTAADSNRPDIVRSIISVLEQNQDQWDSPTLLSDILNEQCGEEGTLLHHAAITGNTDIIRTLLSANIDPGIHNPSGKTAYELAVNDQVRTVFCEELLQTTARSDVGRVCQLLASGIDVNFLDSEESKNTPLHWAASFGNRSIIQCLCARGAVVNAYNSSGSTPLHDAVRRGEVQCVAELLSHGADPSLSVTTGKEEGKTAFDLATGKSDVLNTLNNPPPIASETDAVTDAVKGVKKLVIRTDSGASGGLISPASSNETAANGPLSPTPQLKTPTFSRNLSLNSTLQPPTPVVTEEKLSLLWPQPQSIIQRSGRPFSIPSTLPVYVSTGPSEKSKEVVKIWKLRGSVFQSINVDIHASIQTDMSGTDVPHVICCVNNKICPGTSLYKLTITTTQLKIMCSDYASLHFAISTIYQLFLLYRELGEIPLLLIDDWPDIHYRGVLLDISQGRLPILSSLQALIDTLACLKVNMIHLFCRFECSEIQRWQISYTKMDILHIVDYCLDRGIQMVPVIEVLPTVQFDALDTLYPVFQDFLSCFQDSEFVSLGPRLSSFVLDVDDRSLEVTNAIDILPIHSDRCIQICGYPLHDIDRDLLQRLPTNVIISEYGIHADHDYQNVCTPLSEKGVCFFLCPGTAAWNSLSGCPEAAISNIYNAVKCGVSHGAIGVIACNWTGKGYMTSQLFAWPGFLLNSGLAWNSNCHQDYLYSNLAELLNCHVFCDSKSVVGQIVIELGRAETYITRFGRSQAGGDTQKLPSDHGSILFQLLVNPDSVPLEHISADTIQRAVRHIKKCEEELCKASTQCPSGAQIIEELHLTCDLMLLSSRICRSLVLSGRNPGGITGYAVVNLGMNNLPATVKTDLANRLLELLDPYRSTWSGGYLSSVGLQDSEYILHSLLKILLPDQEAEILIAKKQNGE